MDEVVIALDGSGRCRRPAGSDPADSGPAGSGPAIRCRDGLALPDGRAAGSESTR